MKKIILLFLLFPSLLTAHTTKKVKHYRCSVLQASGLKTVGEIYETGDSTITIIRSLAVNKFDTIIIPVNTIEELKIRRIGNLTRGFVYCVLAGAIVGGVIGYAQGDDPPRKVTGGLFGPPTTKTEPGVTAIEKATSGSITGFFAGALIGPLLGSYSFPYPIKGNKSVYENSRKELMKYSILQK